MSLRDPDTQAWLELGIGQAEPAATIAAPKSTRIAYRTTDLDGDFRRDPRTNHFCARCQKDLKPDQPFRVIHIVNGGGKVVHPEDEAIYQRSGDRGDLGCFPVGMDCARRIGIEFTTSNEGWEIQR